MDHPEPHLCSRREDEEPCEPQRAGWERFYLLCRGKLLIMDFRLERGRGAVMLRASWAEQKRGGGREVVGEWPAGSELGCCEGRWGWAGEQGGKQRCAPRKKRQVQASRGL